MSDRAMRAGERALRSTGSLAELDRLAADLLRAGQLEELAAHAARAISERRRDRPVSVRLEPAAGRSEDEIVGALATGASDPSSSFREPLPEERVLDALVELLVTSACDGDVMDRDQAASIAVRLLGWFGTVASGRMHRAPRWERASTESLRLCRGGSPPGHLYEAGLIIISEHVAGSVWVADGGADCRADGRPCKLEELGVREFNFGQHWRTPGIREVDYETSLPLRLVEEFLAFQLGSLIEPDADPAEDLPLDAALRAAGWPSAREVLRTPQLSSPALEFFAFDLLLAWAGWSPPEGVAHIANSVDSIEVHSGRVTLKGRARPTEPPAPGVRFAYQDF